MVTVGVLMKLDNNLDHSGVNFLKSFIADFLLGRNKVSVMKIGIDRFSDNQECRMPSVVTCGAGLDPGTDLPPWWPRLYQESETLRYLGGLIFDIFGLILFLLCLTKHKV